MSLCSCGFRFLQKRSIVYAEAFASVVVRPCTESDRGAAGRRSHRSPTLPPYAGHLPMDHASSSDLLVRKAQGVGIIVRRRSKRQTFAAKANRKARTIR